MTGEAQPAFRVLGPLEIWDQGRRLEVRAPRQQAMLAILLLSANQVVDQDQLIETLWPGMPTPSATSILHSLVYRLRRFLDTHGAALGARLERSPYGYILHVVRDSVDLYCFERLVAEGRKALERSDNETAVTRLRAGLELWRGEAFAGIDEPVVRERASALNELRLDATEWCLRSELDLGQHEELLTELSRLTVEHPYRERFWELLMTALYRCGRQADALEAYQRLYRLLGEELGVQPGPAVQQLQQGILASEQALNVQPARPAARVPSIPRLLPPRIRDFTGRTNALKALDALLPDDEEPDAPAAIAVVTGTGGIGKTAFAVHWAHRAAERFPDGQLYVNLRGFDPAGRPVRPGEALRLFLEALGAAAQQIPLDLDARAGMYRSLLAGKNVLVLLDNAADEDQVRPLLPAAPGCLTVVTSRNRLSGLVAGYAAQPLGLGLFSESEAREMLEQRLGHDRIAADLAATQNIAELCARLPLALAVAAARVAEQPDFPLAALAELLRESRARLDALALADSTTDPRAVFSWSYRSLSEGGARLFRLLGLHPAPDIAVPAVASLAGVPESEAQPLLDELANAHLVSEARPVRYALHDLLRAYANELQQHFDSAAERLRATMQLLDHYLHTGFAAARLLDPHRHPITLPEPVDGVRPEEISSAEQAFEWFATERTVGHSLVALAAAAGLDDHTWQLAWTLADFDERQGHLQDKEISGLLALTAVERLGDKDAQARMQRSLGRVYSKLGDYGKARRHSERSLVLSAELNDLAGQGGSLQNLGMLLGEQGQHAEALRYEQQAVELFRAAGRRTAEASALNAVGWRLAVLGDYESALGPCEQALALQREAGDRFHEAHTLDSIGYIHQHRGSYARAVECYRQAIELFQLSGESYWLANTLTNLGDTLRVDAGPPAGCQEWERALDILTELDHPDAEGVRARLTG